MAKRSRQSTDGASGAGRTNGGGADASEPTQSEIERAIEAALQGKILIDEEIDSDEASGVSDDDDAADDERDDDAAIINEDSADESDELDALDDDPDEGDLDDFSQSDAYDSEEETRDPRIKIVTGADGKPREIRPEIEPGYDSDSSTEEPINTVGDIDMSLYDNMPHIGYDINGKRLMRPAVGKALDSMLDAIEKKEGFTGITDKDTGLDVELTSEELDIIKRIRRAELPDSEFNAYEEYVDSFSRITMQMPLSSAPEPKRRFIPSKNEQKRVMRIVRAIREGRIVPNKPTEQKQRDAKVQTYDVWSNEVAVPDHIMNVRAPKVAPPGHAESYNPPEEYLPTTEEAEEWQTQHKDDRARDFLPKKYGSLRLVPGYSENLQERFDRCLDLYLAPRVRRKKLNIDPESLIPQLPSPQDLRPFPTRTSHIMRGHQGAVRGVHVSPLGDWIASGGEDGTVRIWEALTGRLMRTIPIGVVGTEKEAVTSIMWNPNPETALIAAATGDAIVLVTPPGLFSEEVDAATRDLIDRGASVAAARTSSGQSGNDNCRWQRPTESQRERGVLLKLVTKHPIRQLDWHKRGDYLVSTSSDQAASAVLVHQLSKHLSQAPLARPKGSVQCTCFHPTKPQLFVASQRYVRIYDLQKLQLARTLQPGLKWISSISIHPTGDHVVVASYDKKVVWSDLDLGATPWKTLRYHDKAVRAVAVHSRRPLFATASDDGSVQVFHAKVYPDDLARDPLLVPLKVLRGHDVVKSLGVLDVAWCGDTAAAVPTGANRPPGATTAHALGQSPVWGAAPAWAVSAGSNGQLRLWS